MVVIDDIKDELSFKSWLYTLPDGAESEKTKSRNIAVAIATRSAARVLPIYWQWTLTSDRSHKEHLTTLPVLRSLLISAVSSMIQNDSISAAATNAAAAATNAAYAANSAAAANAAAAYFSYAFTNSARAVANSAAAYPDPSAAMSRNPG